MTGDVKAAVPSWRSWSHGSTWTGWSLRWTASGEHREHLSCLHQDDQAAVHA